MKLDINAKLLSAAMVLVIATIFAIVLMGGLVSAQGEGPPSPRTAQGQTPAQVAALAAPLQGGVMISSGVVMLGVNELGELIVPDGPPSPVAGITLVGLRYLPTGNEAVSHGSPAEGWGVADTLSGVYGWANQYYGSENLTLHEFITSTSTAMSVVSVGNTYSVTHNYHPSPSPNLYQTDIVITNTSSVSVELRYRRVADWDIEPTIFDEHVTIDQGTASDILFTSNDGFASANPLSGPSDLGYTGTFIDAGPEDHGALFDLDFGRLDAGETKRFTLYYGAAGSEIEAIAALKSVGAEAYSFGQPGTPSGGAEGTPNTFILAFTEIGGTPIVFPAAVYLIPSEALGGGLPGSTVIYTETVYNLTGAADSFDLTVAGAGWPTALSDTNTGPIPDGGSFDFTVQVDVPAGASGGDSDIVTVTASSASNPGLYSATATLSTYALSEQRGYVFNADAHEINLVDTLVHVDTGTAIDTGPGSWPWRGALSPDGQRLYASLRDVDQVLVVDTATHTPVTTLTVGAVPFGIAFSGDGTYAFVANLESDSVSVIDTGVPTVTTTINVGDGPQSIASSPCLDKVYVVHRWDYTIDVIDVNTLAVVDTISGFDDQLWDIVISPYGHRAYVSNQWDAVIYVIDTFSDTWIDTWKIGASSIEGLDISPDGQTLYVASNTGGITYVVDAFSGRVIDRIATVPSGGRRGAWEVEVFPAGAGSFAYVSSPGSGEVTVVDTNTNSVVRTIGLGGGPRGLALFPPETTCLSGEVLLEPSVAYGYGDAGATVVFTETLANLTGATDSFDLALSGNTWSAALSIANTGPISPMASISFTVQVDIPAGAEPRDYDSVALTATSVSNPSYTDSAELTTAVPRPGYVFSRESDEITVVDTHFHADTGIAIDTSPYGEDPWRGALSPDGNWLYVSFREGSEVLVVDTATYTPVTTVTVGSQPHGIAFTADGAYAFVVNRGSSTVSVIDTSGPVVTATIPVSATPHSVATCPCLDKGYVTNRDEDTVSVIDTLALTVTRVITGFEDPWDVVISPFGDRAYVSNADGRSVGVIDTADDTLVDTWDIPGAGWLSGIDIAYLGERLYVTDSENGFVYVLDTSTGQVIESVFTGTGGTWEESWEVEVFPTWAGAVAYVTVPGGDAVRVLDLGANAVVGTILVGNGPRGLALFPAETTCATRIFLPQVMQAFP